jgi:two-component system chemotaxis sensor kinase CheA
MKISIKLKLLCIFLLLPVASVYIFSQITSKLIREDKISYSYALLSEQLKSRQNLIQSIEDKQIQTHLLAIDFFNDPKKIEQVLLNDEQLISVTTLNSKTSQSKNIFTRTLLSKDLEKIVNLKLKSYAKAQKNFFELISLDIALGYIGFIRRYDDFIVLSVFKNPDIKQSFFESGLVNSALINLDQKDSLYSDNIFSGRHIELITKEINDLKNNGLNSGTFEFVMPNAQALLLSFSVLDHQILITSIEKNKTLEAIDRLKNNTYLYLIAVISISIILAILLARTLSNPILEIFKGTQEIKKGNYDVKFNIKTRDEIFELGNSFEAMAGDIKDLLAKLKRYNEELEKTVLERTAQLRRAMSLQKAILESLGQGFFIFNKEAKILDVYSKASEEMFNTEVSGKQFTHILPVSPEEKANTTSLISEIFAQTLPFDDLSSLLIGQVKNQLDHDIFIKYAPYSESENTIDGVIVVATDKTQELKFQKMAQSERAYVKMVLKVLKNPVHFKSLITNSLGQLAQYLKLDQSKFSANLDELKRIIHTTKGSLDFYHLETITSDLHSLETYVKENPDDSINTKKLLGDIKTKLDLFIYENPLFFGPSLSPQDKVRILALDFYNRFKNDFSAQIKANFYYSFCLPPVSEYISYIPDLAQELAIKLDKKLLPVKITGETFHCPIQYEEFFKNLVHLFRNSIDHGIEKAEQRSCTGKNLFAQIALDFALDQTDISQAQSFKIIYSDDGAGIDTKRIKTLTGKELTDQEALTYIYNDGFSTNQNVSDISGRGIGMGAVKAEVEKLNGSIEILNKPGLGLTFKISLPFHLDV